MPVIDSLLPKISELLLLSRDLYLILAERLSISSHNPQGTMAFILDPSTDPEVMGLYHSQCDMVPDTIFRVSSMIVWAVHKHRMCALGLNKYHK